jgi:hypothetical protein
LEGKLAIFRAFGPSSPQIALRRRGRDSKDSFFAPPPHKQRLIKDELATIPNLLAKGQGRRKDMIIRGGENIYPREIEDVLYTHPAVMGASIVGIPDRDWGEVPVGFVQIKPGHEVAGQELSEFCRERLASYKVPRIWRFVDQFPQTASGKIQKYVLCELYLAEKVPWSVTAMSALGHKRTFCDAGARSALPPGADID